MLRSVGLTPRLVFLVVVVIWPAVMATSFLLPRPYFDTADRDTERLLRAVVGSLLEVIQTYRLPEAIEEVREEVFLRTVKERRDLPALALFIMNQDARLEALARERNFGDDLAPRPMDLEVYKGREPLTEVLEHDRLRYLALSESFWQAGRKYVLRAEIALPDRRDADRAAAETTVLVALGASLLALLLLVLFVRLSVSRPIGLLAQAMSEIRVELGRTLPVHHEDQFGELIRTFNEMTIDLRRAADNNRRLMGELQSLNLGLEKRVLDATRDLQDKNAEILSTQQRLVLVQQDISRLERLASLGQLSSTLAHELSTPLNVVLGHLEILQREVADQDGPAARVRTLTTQVNRLVGILKEMLSAVRLPDPKPAAVPLRGLVEEIMSFVAPSLATRQIAVVKRFPDGEAVALADRHQAQQVILNLVSNALQATPDGGSLVVEVVLGTKRVGVRVRDTGRGIPEEDLPRIFEPFFTTKLPDRGHGLGLSISSEIMRKNGGTISAANHPDGGAVFEITFRSAAGEPGAPDHG